MNAFYRRQRQRLIAIALTLPIGLVTCSNLYGETGTDLIKKLQSLSSSDQSNQVASVTLKQLNAAKDVTLIDTLRAMKDSTPIGKNWLLGLASTLYRKSGASQTSELTTFLKDKDQDGEARYTVFEWLTTDKPELRKTLLATMQQDPSPELRFLSISDSLEVKPDATGLKSLLDSARHPDQVVSIIGKLKEMGTAIDQPRQFGFVMDWKLLGPFDNVGTVNFEKSFAVESDWVNGSVKPEYEGKSGVVTWKTETTKNEEGIIDLAAAFSNEKGCIVYAMAEFESDQERDAELRLGCINGNKTWLNGKLVMSNEVYHTNMQIDQYAEKVRLKAGTNRILLKICQNEQKEQWAQRYAFQLRVSDSTGKAILAKGR
jgi:hypothetical protein